MARRRWQRALAAVAAWTAAAIAAPLISRAADPPQANPVAALETTLNSSNQQTARNEAAQRLLEIGTPAARKALQNAVASNDDRAHLAAARALDDDTAADAQMVPPLGSLLRRDPRAADAAARALANYAVNGTPGAQDQLLGIMGDDRQPAASRAAAARAAGIIVDKHVADTLVKLLDNPAQDPSVRNAAGDALIDMTGLTSNDRDARLWTQWFNANNRKSEAAWKADVLAQSYAQLQREHERLRQLRRDVAGMMHVAYDAAPAAQKPKVLLDYLNNTDADIRSIGASIVPDALAGVSNSITPEIKEKLADLVSDSSADVRIMAARALRDINYRAAFDKVLAQLQQEHNPEVQIALIQAAALLGELKGVPVLRRKLHDPSLRVATQAAEALRSLGKQLRQNDPQQAKDVAQELDQVMRARTGPPGQPNRDVQAQEFRAAVVAAAAQLGDQNLRDTFRQLLDPAEPKATRIAALEGLGELGETAAEFVAHELDPGVEPDPDVRLAALDAMARSGSFLYAHQLDALMRPENEPNPDVQKRAWIVFQALLPTGAPGELSEWANQYKRRGDPNREAVVLSALCDKLAAAGKEKDLAAQDETLGDLYLSPKVDRPREAIAHLKRALDYWRRQHAQSVDVEHLITSLETAYLRNKQYDDAIAFAEDCIRSHPANQIIVGPPIRDAAEGLIKNGEKDPASYRDAARLIDLALKMNPQLQSTLVDDLVKDRKRIPQGAASAG